MTKVVGRVVVPPTDLILPSRVVRIGAGICFCIDQSFTAEAFTVIGFATDVSRMPRKLIKSPTEISEIAALPPNRRISSVEESVTTAQLNTAEPQVADAFMVFPEIEVTLAPLTSTLP